jgi:hypothetical protein
MRRKPKTPDGATPPQPSGYNIDEFLQPAADERGNSLRELDVIVQSNRHLANHAAAPESGL